MKYLHTITFTLFIYTAVFSQKNSTDTLLKQHVEKQATLMAKLLLQKNYVAFADYTYPPILNMMGGAKKMAGYLKESFKQMEADGFVVVNVSAANCSNIIRCNNQLQCTLTETLEIKYKGGKMVQKSTIIGISNNKGLNWTFIDTHGAPLEALQKTLKELSNELVIPKKSKPEMIAD